MSIPLTQEERSESALVAFTLLVPASAGVALFALAFGGGVRPAITALALACVGMTGSITHLAKPLRAPTSLRNVRSSWLSREIAAVSVFWAFELAWLGSEAALTVSQESAFCIHRCVRGLRRSASGRRDRARLQRLRASSVVRARMPHGAHRLCTWRWGRAIRRERRALPRRVRRCWDRLRDCWCCGPGSRRFLAQEKALAS